MGRDKYWKKQKKDESEEEGRVGDICYACEEERGRDIKGKNRKAFYTNRKLFIPIDKIY